MVREVNRPDKTARHRLGKSDEIDADLAARALLSGSATNVPKSGEGVVEMLRMLKSTRDSATEARVKAINQIKAILVTAPDSLRDQLRELSNPLLVRACSRLQSMEMASPLAAAIRSLRLLGRRCLWLTEEIEQLSHDLDALTLQAAPQLRELHGVGVDAASTLLIAAGDNPERIRSESAFAALCGVNPLPASSGKTNRHRLNRGGNRKANCALWRIVLVRLRWHEATKNYMERRTLEGKGKREIIRCLKRYVAREIYKVLLVEIGMPGAKQAPC
jgi:transposase